MSAALLCRRHRCVNNVGGGESAAAVAACREHTGMHAAVSRGRDDSGVCVPVYQQWFDKDNEQRCISSKAAMCQQQCVSSGVSAAVCQQRCVGSGESVAVYRQRCVSCVSSGLVAAICQ